MDELISKQKAVDAIKKWVSDKDDDRSLLDVIRQMPSAQPDIVYCKDCKHNPNLSWFGCPMSHLSETQRPETAWCWKAERREVTT